LFVAEWIDNAPFNGSAKEHDLEKPKCFARTKNVPRSGPFSAMYFGNDVLLCGRNRTSGEIQDAGKHRSSLRPSSANDTCERIFHGETVSPARSRATTLLASPQGSSISLTDDSQPVSVRARRDAAAGSAKKSSKTASIQQTSIRKMNADGSEESSSDQDLFRREREYFLKERSVFLREREQFLTDKERFHGEKERLIQDIHREKEGIAREKEELAHQRGKPKAAAKNVKSVTVSREPPAPLTPPGSTRPHPTYHRPSPHWSE
jgi:hypothetical protein